MKLIITILSIIFLSASLSAQRDTLDSSLIYVSDSIYWSKAGSDSMFTFQYEIDDAINSVKRTYNTTYSMQDSIDSLMKVINIYIEQQKTFVEQYYELYKQTNSKLWNLQRQYARLEELYDALYNP